jgi:hypothetical protein
MCEMVLRAPVARHSITRQQVRLAQQVSPAAVTGTTPR